jgi:hypothetical protein
MSLKDQVEHALAAYIVDLNSNYMLATKNQYLTSIKRQLDPIFGDYEHIPSIEVIESIHASLSSSMGVTFKTAWNKFATYLAMEHIIVPMLKLNSPGRVKVKPEYIPYQHGALTIEEQITQGFNTKRPVSIITEKPIVKTYPDLVTIGKELAMVLEIVGSAKIMCEMTISDVEVKYYHVIPIQKAIQVVLSWGYPQGTAPKYSWFIPEKPNAEYAMDYKYVNAAIKDAGFSYNQLQKGYFIPKNVMYEGVLCTRYEVDVKRGIKHGILTNTEPEKKEPVKLTALQAKQLREVGIVPKVENPEKNGVVKHVNSHGMKTALGAEAEEYRRKTIGGKLMLKGIDVNDSNTDYNLLMAMHPDLDPDQFAMLIPAPQGPKTESINELVAGLTRGLIGPGATPETIASATREREAKKKYDDPNALPRLMDQMAIKEGWITEVDPKYLEDLSPGSGKSLVFFAPDSPPEKTITDIPSTKILAPLLVLDDTNNE